MRLQLLVPHHFYMVECFVRCAGNLVSAEERGACDESPVKEVVGHPTFGSDSILNKAESFPTRSSSPPVLLRETSDNMNSE